MALVRVRVVGRPLQLGAGLLFGVGERTTFDDSKKQHAECIRRGWVEIIPSASGGSAPSTAAVDAAPKHKMMRRKTARRKKAT